MLAGRDHEDLADKVATKEWTEEHDGRRDLRVREVGAHNVCLAVSASVDCALGSHYNALDRQRDARFADVVVYAGTKQVSAERGAERVLDSRAVRREAHNIADP